MRKLDSHARGYVAGAGTFAILFLIYFTFNHLDLYPSRLVADQDGHNQMPLVASQDAHKAASSRSPLDDIQNGTLGFEKVFIISMASRSDQRDVLTLGAAYLGIDIEFIDGVTEVNPKAVPPMNDDLELEKGTLNAWRAHMNAIRRMVEDNITSAIILEGDVDWDVRIKSQLRDFAEASWTLIQPLKGTTNEYLDPTYPFPKHVQQPPVFNVADALPNVVEPTTSPYGDIDRWDILWLGHCGSRLPNSSLDDNVPIGRTVISDDETVPSQRHLNMEWGDDELIQYYPPHSRVVSRARMNTCSLAYALTQQSARSILYELGVREVTGAFDMMLRAFTSGEEGRPLQKSFSVLPQLFQHHRPIGHVSHFSDIQNLDDSFNDRATSTNIRWSTRVNLPVLAAGRKDFIDTYPDDD